MRSIRLLPVVILAITALLVLKTLGLIVTGSYVLGGVTVAQAEEGGEHGAPAPAQVATDGTMTLPVEPTMADSSPTLADASPTLGQHAAGEHGAAPAAGDHAAAAEDHGHPAPVDVAQAETGHDAAPAGEGGGDSEGGGEHGVEAGLPAGLDVVCPPTDPAAPATPALGEGQTSPAALDPTAAAAAPAGDDPSAHTTPVSAGCVPLTDALPARLGANGPIPMVGENGQTLSEAAVLESLGKRRAELQNYEQELTLRSSLVDAAEKKVAERQATLQALEDQISALVDQRKQLESDQFTGIVTLYENMKPKDAATIFNTLDMEVLLRVAKLMNPRKMSPILAAMEPTRAQELTVRMAALSDQAPDQIAPDALAALPQIVGK